MRTEVVAGITTWLTMAYILFLNPQILGAVTDSAGTTLGFPQVLTVTALVAGVMTLAMGLWANYPFAIASGLGLNAFVAFTLVAGNGLTWPEAMGVIVVEGLVITLLVLTGFRNAILNAIPMDLKRSIAIGIGLFLTIIGLVNAGIVVQAETAVPPLGITTNFTSLRILTFVIGLALCSILVMRKVRGGLLIGIIGTTIIAAIVNAIWGDNAIWDAVGPGIAQVPDSVTATPDFSLLGNFSFGFFATLGFWAAIVPVFAVMLSDFFDTMGTAVGLGEEAGLLDERRDAPEHEPRAAGRLGRGGRGGRRERVVEHDVHRIRLRDQRGRAHRARVGRDRRVVPPLRLPLAARRSDPAGGHRPRPGHRRVLHDARDRRDRLARSRRSGSPRS